MNGDSKVVPFECTPKYLFRCAQQKLEGKQYTSALEFLYRAIAIDPKNRECRMCIAAILSTLGYVERSSSIIMDMIAEGDVPMEAYRKLFSNYACIGNPPLCSRALERYWEKIPDERAAEDIQFDNASRKIPSEMVMWEYGKRKRSIFRVSRMAWAAMNEGRFEIAARLYRRAMYMYPKSGNMSADYAMAMMKLNRRNDLEIAISHLISRSIKTDYHLASYVKAMMLTGRREMAGITMLLYGEDFWYRPYCYNCVIALEAYGEKIAARTCAQRMVTRFPFSRHWLHLLAVTRKHCGDADGDVAKVWKQILRIDPEDGIARFYWDAAQAGKLGDYTLEYHYQVPLEEYDRRKERIDESFSQTPEAIQAIWASDADFRTCIRWAFQTSECQMHKKAIRVLDWVDCEVSNQELRLIMCNARLTTKIRRRAAGILQRRGEDIRKYLVIRGKIPETEFYSAREIISQLSARDRQVVYCAYDAVAKDYREDELLKMAKLWKKYRKTQHYRGDWLTHFNETAIALAYAYCCLRSRRGIPNPAVRMEKIIRHIGGNRRLAMFYTKRLLVCLEIRDNYLNPPEQGQFPEIAGKIKEIGNR